MYIMNKTQKAGYIENLEDVKNARTLRDAEGWRKYYASMDYVVFDGGEVLQVSRPGIDSTIWYNDETPDPMAAGSREDVFIAYNVKHFNDYKLEEWKKCRRDLASTGCCMGWYVEKPFLMAGPRECWPVFISVDVDKYNDYLMKEKGYNRRELTPEEVETFAVIINQLKEKYIKRLRTYYKRYPDRVRSCGYWANR